MHAIKSILMSTYSDKTIYSDKQMNILNKITINITELSSALFKMG